MLAATMLARPLTGNQDNIACNHLHSTGWGEGGGRATPSLDSDPIFQRRHGHFGVF